MLFFIFTLYIYNVLFVKKAWHARAAVTCTSMWLRSIALIVLSHWVLQQSPTPIMNTVRGISVVVAVAMTLLTIHTSTGEGGMRST